MQSPTIEPKQLSRTCHHCGNQVIVAECPKCKETYETGHTPHCVSFTAQGRLDHKKCRTETEPSPAL